MKKAPHLVELSNIVFFYFYSYTRLSSTQITMDCLQQQQQQIGDGSTWFIRESQFNHANIINLDEYSLSGN
jgi:hypothetical protein